VYLFGSIIRNSQSSVYMYPKAKIDLCFLYINTDPHGFTSNNTVIFLATTKKNCKLFASCSPGWSSLQSFAANDERTVGDEGINKILWKWKQEQTWVLY
jgi:hypothetical protein